MTRSDETQLHIMLNHTKHVNANDSLLQDCIIYFILLEVYNIYSIVLGACTYCEEIIGKVAIL